MKTVKEIFNECLSVHEERTLVYKDAHLVNGKIIEAFFPDGLNVIGANDINRMTLILNIIGKVQRYTLNFDKGHKDSIIDLINYAGMLLQLESSIQEKTGRQIL